MSDKTQRLFIPEKIRVGFQTREDTYTGKLAYVIYFDQKGKVRKEKSWLGWCDLPKGYKGSEGQDAGNHWRNRNSKGIKPIDFENVPTEGFVLNKGVGGARRSYGWNARNEYIRVYDPRDFEFEISVANLLFILRECDCSRGKGLEGKFVYSWDRSDLVLLPVTAQDYKNSMEFTELQAKKISAKELVAGATYMTRQQETLIYLGRFDKHHTVHSRYRWDDDGAADKKKAIKKFHTFWNPKTESYEFLSSMAKLATCTNESPVPNLAEMVDEYYKSIYGSPVVKLTTKAVRLAKPKGTQAHHHRRSDMFVYEEGNRYRQYYIQQGSNYYASHEDRRNQKLTQEPDYRVLGSQVYVEDGVLIFDSQNSGSYSYPPGYENDRSTRMYGGIGGRHTKPLPWQGDLKPMKLVAHLESGSKFVVGNHSLEKPKRKKKNG